MSARAHIRPVPGDDRQRAFDVAATVCDPEIPVLTIADLGILRGVDLAGDGQVVVTITPTYSGCPAMQTIGQDVIAALSAAGFSGARVELVHAPAWTTDWMSDEGKRKLTAYGIAPPGKKACGRSARFSDETVPCPRCGSEQTMKISAFGSTACKAHYRCESCLEPFDHFKCI